MGASKKQGGTAPTTHTPFRTAERYWKSRTTTLDLSTSFHQSAIQWSETEPEKGQWVNDKTGMVVECVKISLDGFGPEGMGQSRWKGKAKEVERDGEEKDYAIIMPLAFPGLVLLPSLLSPPLQRSLIRESLLHSKLPNTTSLCAHYPLPSDGLWQTYVLGRGDERITRRDLIVNPKLRRETVTFEPVTSENWKEVGTRAQELNEKEKKKLAEQEKEKAGEVERENDSSVEELLRKLRWTNIGWHYNWTSKAYDFERGKIEVPPLIADCCRSAARAIPWDKVFGTVASGPSSDSDDTVKGGRAWESWRETYEPEAGIINFYQLKDSLTAHIDQSEVDAVRPLVSLSLGHSAIFLIGGPTRDTEPLAITLESGDGLIMSGHAGRRVFHGLPRVLENTLPPYLASTLPVNAQEEGGYEWKNFGEFMEWGTRININVREVFGGKIE